MNRKAFFVTLLLVAVTAQADDTDEPIHVDLDTTTIKASKELPSVMAVVPWKRALPAGLGGRPEQSLVDSVLKPLDPEVFRLQQDFYRQLFTAKTSSPDSDDKTQREKE